VSGGWFGETFGLEGAAEDCWGIGCVVGGGAALVKVGCFCVGLLLRLSLGEEPRRQSTYKVGLYVCTHVCLSASVRVRALKRISPWSSNRKQDALTTQGVSNISVHNTGKETLIQSMLCHKSKRPHKNGALLRFFLHSGTLTKTKYTHKDAQTHYATKKSTHTPRTCCSPSCLPLLCSSRFHST
jgi:hypothetical protein